MGFLKDVFGGGDDPKLQFTPIPQTPESTESRKRLFELATGEPPEVPRQEVAPLPARTEERDIARTTAKELIAPQDIFNLPEVQGIIQEARVTGDLLANRLSRMMQASGNLTSTTGRDVLGRAVTDVQKSLAASLAPFASEERQRRTSLIPILESLGLTEEERERVIAQAELDAQFQQQYGQFQQKGILAEQGAFNIPLLRDIIGLQPGVQPTIEKEGLSTWGTLGKTFLPQLIGPLMSMIIGGAGAGAAAGSPASILPGTQSSVGLGVSPPR